MRTPSLSPCSRPPHAAHLATLATLVALSTALAATDGRAQSLSRGVRLPMPSVSLADDVFGMDVNPAGLGLVRSFEAGFVASQLSTGVGGTGEAGYFALPLPFGFAVGFAVSHLGTQVLGLGSLGTTTGGLGELSRRFDDFARLSFSAAWSPSPRFSFGLTTHRLFGDAPQVSGFTTLDMGMTIRPSRWVSFGAAVRDLTTPSVNGYLSPVLLQPGVPAAPVGGQVPIVSPKPQATGGLGGLAGLGSLGVARPLSLHRTWVMGLGIRPGTERVFIGADVAIEEIARHVDPTIRVMFEPVPGLSLGGAVSLRDRDTTTELTAQLGLTWAFDAAGVRGGLTYASSVERGRGHDGFTVAARFHGARERVLPEARGRFLRISLQGGMPESAPPRGLLGGGSAPRWTHPSAVLALEAALWDARISGVTLSFDDVSMGLAQAEELRALILRLRAAGKRVFAHMNGASNGTYLAASAAERLYLSPVTTLNTVGFASSSLFLRGLLDKIGVLPEFIAAGKYKSAPETLTRKNRSGPAREATTAFLNDAMERLVAGIAENRKRSAAEVRGLVEKSPLTAGEAVAAGWADGVLSLDELNKRLEKDTKLSLRYLRDVGAPAGDRWGGYDGVAVIHVEGTISDGKSSTDPVMGGRNAGAETIVAALREAKRSPRIKAVVLRINSPGGSVGASERILREVQAVKKRKPLIASFGNLAASGGYYIACDASEIFAEPTTLTGSIGVFFGKPAVTGLLDKGDIHSDTIKTGPHADIMSFSRPWTDAERALLTRLVGDTYSQFLDHVARGRKMTKERAREVAEGRIWSGQAAHGLKLVDRLGGLTDAVARAKELAGWQASDRVGIVQLPRATFLSQVLARIGADSDGAAEKLGRAARVLVPALRGVSPWLMHLKSGEPWAILPIEIELR